MIDYSDNIWSLCRLKGSVMPEALLQSLPSTVFALLLCLLHEDWPDVREEAGWVGLSIAGLTWNAMTLCIGILLTFRIKQSLGRFWEGTGLLHQMRGEWFDAVSCLMSFSRDARVNGSMHAEVIEFRGTLIRLMSLMHGSALDEISDVDVCFEVIDIAGLDTQTLVFLRQCQEKCTFSKVEALQHLVQVLITDSHERGVLNISAPILSRVYQTLSRGFVHLLNARKIRDTMFPFPFVQTIKVLLLVHSFVTPAVMTTVLDTNVWAVLFTFIPLFGLHCLNLAAWQLEMPFGADPNDLPLQQFQDEMNDTLIMLACEGSDHCPTISKAAVPLQHLAGDMRLAKSFTRTADAEAFLQARLLDDQSSITQLETISSISAVEKSLSSPWDQRIKSVACVTSNTRSIFEEAVVKRWNASDDGLQDTIGSSNTKPGQLSAMSSRSLFDSSREFSNASVDRASLKMVKHVNELPSIPSIHDSTSITLEERSRTPRPAGEGSYLKVGLEGNVMGGSSRDLLGYSSRDRDFVMLTPNSKAPRCSPVGPSTPVSTPRKSTPLPVPSVGFDRPALFDKSIGVV